MEISTTLVKHLAKLGIAYDIVRHAYTNNSLHTAQSAHISPANMVKPVVLEDNQGYVMALVPSNQHVKINDVNMVVNRNMDLVTEHDLDAIFSDCDHGAIPPVGDAYGMPTVVDSNLDECDDLYIEAGNHTDLLHISGRGFQKLTENSYHAYISVH